MHRSSMRPPLVPERDDDDDPTKFSNIRSVNELHSTSDDDGGAYGRMLESTSSCPCESTNG